MFLLTDHINFSHDTILEHVRLDVNTRGKYRESHEGEAKARIKHTC